MTAACLPGVLGVPEASHKLLASLRREGEGSDVCRSTCLCQITVVQDSISARR